MLKCRRENEMEEKNLVAETIKKAVDTSVRLKEKGVDFFVMWSPHVSMLRISVHYKGWHNNNETDADTCISFDTCPLEPDPENPAEKLDRFIKKVEENYGN
jgi:hypothetical protein